MDEIDIIKKNKELKKKECRTGRTIKKIYKWR